MSEAPGRLSDALAGRYVIERELGQGGMATVYLAHDVRHDRKVALKVLRNELAAVIGAERFLVEIKTTANLQHPHILPLHDSGEADGTVFYVMPYVEGESLRDRLTRERQLPVDDAVRIACEVADALDYAHRHGVIHRDIKPENILLHDDRALVADFGIALAVSRSEGGTRMTETGMSLGTPHYMSPEQAMGEREITAKSDVYALGCVLYEMLAGEPPFAGPTAQAVIARVLTEEPRSLTLQRRTVPPHVEAAVLKALAKLPADRFATAAQFSDALANPSLAPAVTARSAVMAPSAVPSPRRAAVTLTLAATTVVALALAAWGWFRLQAAEHRPAAWQYIALSDSVTAALDYPAMALSPDGATLVFKDGRQNSPLWIKQRGQLDPTPIPGTERAQNPVFSPDGQWIAFVADQHLKKVRRTGGATLTIADSAANGFGGAAWLDDGTLVYVSPTLTTLRRVSESGGSSTVVLSPQLDSALGGGGTGHPVALPGARGVLFQVCSSGCVTMSIHVLDLRTGVQKPLLDDVAQAWYLPDGRLLYVRRDGVALAAPFDLDRLEITGEAVPVLEGVQVQPGQGFALLAWSRAGSLVYVHGTATSTDVALVRVSRDGLVAPIDTAWYGPFNSLSVSPDGRRLAVGVGSGGGLNIWIKQLDHGPFTRLTFSNRDRRPAWSPDGRLVAFVRDSAGTSSVYARPPDGSGPDRPLAHLDRMVQEVTWSPDGRWLVLRTDNAMAGAGDLVGVRTSGDTIPVPLVASSFTELHPAVSPDGRWLAYTSNESGTNEVYVRPFPNTNDGHWQVSNGGGASPVWAPSGRELYYLNRDGRLIAAEVQATATTFAVGRLVPLFDASIFLNDAFHQGYAVTPDGRSFIFVSPRGGSATSVAPQIVWVDHWFTDLEARLRQ
jgi:Tol biopolymer transport system component/tRNA A-37 threonylcarbamoyl transferase component Bud32